jgi:hypothetical protein
MQNTEPLWSQKYLDATRGHESQRDKRFLANYDASKSMTWFTFMVILSVGMFALYTMK